MDLVQLISQVGFPIGVAIYSLVVLNKTVAENTKVTLILTEKFSQFEGTLRNRDGNEVAK